MIRSQENPAANVPRERNLEQARGKKRNRYNRSTTPAGRRGTATGGEVRRVEHGEIPVKPAFLRYAHARRRGRQNQRIRSSFGQRKPGSLGKKAADPHSRR